MTRSFGNGSGKRTPASEQEPCGDDEAAGDLKHPEPLGEHAQREDRCEEGLKIGIVPKTSAIVDACARCRVSTSVT
jgi:hypothetical protein